GRLARLLLEEGVTPGSIVGIKLFPSIEMVAGILAILKAGGAYLPIDPDYPQERIDFMLADSAAELLLTASDGALDLTPRRRDPITPATRNSQPATHLCYVIYTSGSTGKPKGVAVEHRSVVNLLFSLFQSYLLGPGDSYLLKTSFIFDVSVSELFGWFMGGGRLIISGKDERKDAQQIIDKIELSQATHINFVPSLFNVFVELLEREPRNIAKLSSLKYIFLAGEALSAQLVKRFRASGCRVILENLYGPTEGTVYAAGYSLSRWSGEGSIPIGKPLRNMALYILGRRGQLQPVGVPGELVITGAGPARGYLNNPQLTADRFGPGGAPSLSTPLYRTGDLARWLSDGNIEFLGRIDDQVKIRGFRIEPEEIKNELLNHPELKDAVVIAKESSDG
ncbi:MAG: amino acid adenylation domain-containing protein, partial [bacterium]|nr:amino acid adenylation domain-containing protein [bacterium]